MHVLSDEQKLGEAGSARAGSITVSGDRPLHGLAKFAVISSAALAILLFYLYVIGAVLVLITCLALELFLFVVLLRLGMSRMVTPYLERHSRLLLHFARSAWLPGTHTEFQVPLEEGDAPRLFAFLRKLAQRLKVPAPRQVLIEMSSGAWVKLKGVRQGANATTLGLGYDLLAGLSERELEAVLAHEMAHAKFVRRGLKRLLNGGVGRAARLANGLSAMVDAYRRAHESFALAEWLLAGADRTARLAVRLVAAYSRQDEFEADRGAAEICGAGPLRTSLLKLEQMAKKTARISWNERVARLQRGEGFSDWLVGELQVGISAETGASEVFDLYSTHPSIRDRVAALPEDSVPRPEGASAIQVLENPDQIATRLVAEIHRVGSLEEKRDSRERLRWLKRVQRGGATRGTQWLGALILVTGIIVGAFAWVDRFSPPTLLVAFGLIAGGVALCRYRGPRDRWNLPVPGYEALKRAQRSPDDPSTRDARQAAIKAELEQTMAGLSKREKLARLRAEAGIALERCDYLRAYAATRRRDELDKPDPESLMIGAVASAGLQLHSQAGNLLEGVVKDARLRSPGSCWGAAWTLFLLGDWPAAEALLLSLEASCPADSNRTALLAECQGERNKLQSAIVNARIALAVAPRSVDRVELLAGLLLSAGYLLEAEQLLNGVGPDIEQSEPLVLAMIRLHLLQRNFPGADKCIERLRQKEISAAIWIEIGGMLEIARRDEQATASYGHARAQGFYPAAELSLARLALHRNDRTTARQHVLAALDLSRPLGEKAVGPLDLFVPTLGVLLEMEEPVADAGAWIATFSGDAALGPFARRSFLVFARGANEAEQYVRTVVNAAAPDKPPFPPPLLRMTLAPRDRQPIGVVRRGIQSFWNG